MKITAMTTLAVLAGVAAQAGDPGQRAERRVTVCMEMGLAFSEATQAKAIASRMFSGIGVTIDWRHRCPADGILISLAGLTPANRLPGALAYAMPYEGTHIVIFYDRVQESTQPNMVPRVLAHVLVHEITHILQGVSRHSSQGLMKARWDDSDYSAMTWKPLPFASEDIDLIYKGLATRAGRASARLVARVEAAPPAAR
jgi:hypothetical protein